MRNVINWLLPHPALTVLLAVVWTLLQNNVSAGMVVFGIDGHDHPDARHRIGGDRILALDTMFINAIGLIVLLGIYQGTQIYFEAALIIAMLGFVSTVAYARFVLRGDIIE